MIRLRKEQDGKGRKRGREGRNDGISFLPRVAWYLASLLQVFEVQEERERRKE